MNHERYCADRLQVLEGEQFLAVGDGRVARLLNPAHEQDRRLGKGEPLPDLLSVVREEGARRFRLREVKFKLEARLVRRALIQLRSGAIRLRMAMTLPFIDRMEIVVPLAGRPLKPAEKEFLGENVGPGRYRLRWEEIPEETVTVLLL